MLTSMRHFPKNACRTALPVKNRSQQVPNNWVPPPPDEISTRRDSFYNSTQAPHKHKVQFTNHCILSHNSAKFILFQFTTDETHLPVATENHYSFDHKLTDCIEQSAYKFQCLVRMIRIARWNMPSNLGNTLGAGFWVLGIRIWVRLGTRCRRWPAWTLQWTVWSWLHTVEDIRHHSRGTGSFRRSNHDKYKIHVPLQSVRRGSFDEFAPLGSLRAVIKHRQYKELVKILKITKNSPFCNMENLQQSLGIAVQSVFMPWPILVLHVQCDPSTVFIGFRHCS